jgi:hypothetical protein
VTNDVEKLVETLTGSQVMRFGAPKNLYGPESLPPSAKIRPTAGLGRTVKRLDIVSFSRGFSSITHELERFAAGSVCGRLSQVWVRFAEVWCVVRAHNSPLSAF